MSDEAEGLIEETFITKLGAKYPFIKVKGVNEQYGIKFFPSVYTIDTNGNVHSVPDDRMPSESTIEELLKTVSLAPKLPEGAQFDPLRQMWNKKDYLKVQEYLGKMLAAPNLAADLKEVFEAQQQALQKKVEQQQKRVATLAEGPDYYTAKEQLEKVQKEWKGLPPADDATKALATFAADADIKKEIAAGKAFAALLAKYDRSKISQARKLQEELPKFAKKYEHTYAGQQAAKMAESK